MPEEEIVVDDTTKNVVEETPKTDIEPEAVSLPKEEYDRLKKREQDAENYKKENEKYRNLDRLKEITPEKPKEEYPENDQTDLQKDFLSKKEDILHEIKADIASLEDSQWKKIKPLLGGALNGVYENAMAENRYVARGEIREALQELIKYAKGDSQKSKEIEEARIKGAIEQEKMNNVEISGTGTVRKIRSSIPVTEEDKQLAFESGLTPERISELRMKKQKVSDNWENLYKQP